MLEAARRAASADSSDIDQYAFRKMIAVHHAVQQEVLGARAEAARALRAWSLPLQGNDETGLARISELVAEHGGLESNKGLASRLSKLADEGRINTSQINRAVNGSALARTAKALQESWTLGLLTNPTTHIVNLSSNIVTGLTLGVERFGMAAFKDSPVEFREGLEYFTGYFGSMKAALANSAQAWRTGQVGIGLGKIDLPPIRATSREVLDPDGKAGIFSKAIDWYGAALNRVVGGGLAAGDEFSKTVLYNAQLRSLAYRQAKNLGLEGQDAKEHIAKVLSAPPGNLRNDSLEFANYGTFTNALGPSGQSIQRVISATPGARFIVPFVRTPINIFSFTFERTPIGLLSSRIRDDIAQGGIRKSQALAKIGMGSSMMFLGVDMAMNGQVTGAGPGDNKARAKLRSTGWQPYSIKVGNEYYSYSRWDPFATWLGMSTDIAEIMSNYEAYDMVAQREVDELVTASIAAISNQVVGKTFLSGVSDLTEMLANPKQNIGRFTNRFAGSFVPAGVAAIERATNPEQSQVFNMIDAMKARIPGLSKEVPLRRNVYGEVQKSFYPSEDNALAALGERALTLFNPIYYTDPDKPDNPLDQFFLKNGFSGVNMPQKTQKFEVPGSFGSERVAIDLRDFPEIYSRFLEKRGEVRLKRYRDKSLKDFLTDLVNQDVPESKYFFNPIALDHEGQDRFISGVISEYDSQIRDELVDEFSVLRQAIAEERVANKIINVNSGVEGLLREKPFP